MKTIKKASLLFASLALVLGAGLVGNSDTKEVKAEDATISAGENASTAEVKLSDGTTFSAMKAGTSKKNGTLKVAIPQGATKLSFYAAAWNKSSRPTIKISDDKGSDVASLPIKADTGIQNNSPFTLSTNDVSTFLVTTSLSNVTTDTTYTLTSTVRFVVWNATVELGVSKSVKSLESSGKLNKTTYQVGEEFDPTGLTITAYYDDNTSEDVTTGVEWPKISSNMTTSITGSYGGKEITIEGIQVLDYVLSIVTDKTSVQVGDKGQLTYIFKDSNDNEVTVENVIIEWKSSNSDVVTIDSNTGEWVANSAGDANINLLAYVGNAAIEYNASIEMTVCSTIEKVVTGYNKTDTYTFEGVVTNIQGASFYLQQGEYAILVYKSDTLPNGVEVGKKVRITSTIQNYNGLIETNVIKEIVVSNTTEIISPKEVTKISELKELNQSVLFSLKGLTMGSINQANNKRISSIVKLNDESITLNVDPRVATATDFYSKIKLYENMTFDVVGANVGHYSDSAQIAITSLDQIVVHAEQFVAEWAKLRANGGKDGICYYLASEHRAEMQAMLDRYAELSKNSANKAYIDSAEDGGTTIANTIEYVSALLEKLDNNSSTGASGVVITSNNSYDKTSLIALFAILGIVTISGYYIIEKKKFSK